MLILVALSLLALPTQLYSQSTSKATIVRKQIVIVRSGEFAKNFPDRKRATINYPLVTRVPNAAVLQKVRSLLSVGNVFETSIKDYRENNWLDEFDYVVNHNANGILDLTFTQSGMAAYPDTQSRTISIDLRTGNAIKASDVFVETKLPELTRLVDSKLQEELAEIIKAVKEDRTVADGPSIVGALEEAKFELKDLDNLSINKDGVTFLYQLGFPHVHRAFEPNGRYLFSYSTLKPFIKPKGPLGQFIR